MGKNERLKQGNTVTLEGTEYVILKVVRGEGQARAIARAAPMGEKRYYRVVMGQWTVLREKNPRTVLDLK